MHKTAIAAVITATAAAVILAGSAATAHPRLNTWISCADNQASSGQLTIDSVGRGGILAVSGHVDPCAEPRGSDIYTIASYTAHAASAVNSADNENVAAWYANYSAGGRSPFTARIRVGTAGDIHAICLVTGEQSPVHCYEFTTADDGEGRPGAPTVGPTIPVTDPRVQFAVRLPPGAIAGPPSCGSCW